MLLRVDDFTETGVNVGRLNHQGRMRSARRKTVYSSVVCIIEGHLGDGVANPAIRQSPLPAKPCLKCVDISISPHLVYGRGDSSQWVRRLVGSTLVF